jgi:flagellar capping protein FliD
MKVYTASGWIAASSASVATLATFEFVATAGQTVFTGNDANGSSLSYVAPAIIVTLNGVRLRPGDDYTATNGTSITLVSAAALNDELVVDAFGSFLVANTYTIAQADSLLAAKISNTGSQSISGNLTVTNSSGSTIVANRTSNPGSIELQFGGTQTAQLSAGSGGGLAFYRGSTPTLAMQ